MGGVESKEGWRQVYKGCVPLWLPGGSATRGWGHASGLSTEGTGQETGVIVQLPPSPALGCSLWPLPPALCPAARAYSWGQRNAPQGEAGAGGRTQDTGSVSGHCPQLRARPQWPRAWPGTHRGSDSAPDPRGAPAGNRSRTQHALLVRASRSCRRGRVAFPAKPWLPCCNAAPRQGCCEDEVRGDMRAQQTGPARHRRWTNGRMSSPCSPGCPRLWPLSLGFPQSTSQPPSKSAHGWLKWVSSAHPLAMPIGQGQACDLI